MAQSRLEKIGTIFSRVSGLLRAGAMKVEDKPLWYDVYAAFPPKLEPRFDRPAPNIPIRKIFYEEDIIRAKFHKSIKYQELINMEDTKRETQTQQFIAIYKNLKEQGALDDEQIFATALDLLAEKRLQTRSESSEDTDTKIANKKNRTNLMHDFKEAEAQKNSISKKPNSIDIQNLFKE